MFSENKLENAAFILVYLAAVVVLALDLLVWRPF
jgi:hypothetical protein